MGWGVYYPGIVVCGVAFDARRASQTICYRLCSVREGGVCVCGSGVFVCMWGGEGEST